MRIGIDVGGTKIEIIALDSTGRALERKRIPTPQNNYPELIQSIVSLVQELEDKLGRIGTIGIGTPGALSPLTNRIKNSNSRCLIGKPFDSDLGKALKRPIRLSNDANCFTLSEAIDGAARGARVVFGVIIGTGTGGGIVVNKQVLTGPNAIAGEWGHNPIPWVQPDEFPGPPCYCGKSGCIETYLSGPGLAYDFQSKTKQKLTPEKIVSNADKGDKHAIVCLDRYVNRLARGLASVINVLDPDVIVLGGGLSNIRRLYNDVPHQWKHYVFSDQINTVLRPAKHGDSSGVRGAAWLWPLAKTCG